MSTGGKPRIAITMGDPVGIGPEIIIKALEEDIIWERCIPIVFGDSGVMHKSQALLGSKLRVRQIHDIADEKIAGKYINLFPVSNLEMDQFSYGKPTRETGKAMVAYIQKATHLALRKSIDAVVTCPINKAAMSLAGYPYPGHTELLAHETKAADYAMMLAGEKLRVVLVTIHHAFRQVPELLSRGKIVSTIHLSDLALKQYFGISEPRLAVAALNPHAGEGGLFGDEEALTIAPAVQRSKEEGINVAGPYPADSLFFYAVKGDFDAVICMYHDQGLIPLKLLYFEEAINVTLGLPIIRTSVDHGTAYNISGTGKANHRSLVNAITAAADMVLAQSMFAKRKPAQFFSCFS